MSDELATPSRSLTRRTLMAGMVTAGAAAAVPALAPAPASAATPVSFHPGHYFWAPRTRWSAANQADDFRLLDALSTNPYIKGIQIHVHWRFLEGATAGDYSPGFAIVDAYLNKLASLSTKKYLMLCVSERTFTSYSSDAYPQYLIDGGGVVYAPSGTTWTGSLSSSARMWEPAVMDRLIALSRAYAARYNRHPLFEMLSLGETSLAVPTSFGYTDQAWYDQLRRWFTESKKVWTNTVLRLCANYLRNAGWVRNLITHCVNTTVPGGVVVGGPDPELPLPEDTITRTITANQVFRGLDGGQDLRGAVPWIGEVQEMGLGTRFTEPPNEIFDYYYDTMHASYLCWLYNTHVGPAECRWSTGILPFINSIQGRIHTDHPTTGSWTID
jgi:hypothetical protein